MSKKENIGLLSATSEQSYSREELKWLESCSVPLETCIEHLDLFKNI